MSPPTLIFSDLDGTLLDHNSYEFTTAQPALESIQQKKIPLILNSSKTAAEIIHISQQLRISYPFIVENGAGVYLPKQSTLDNAEYDVKVFGRERREILAVLHALRDEYRFKFKGFNDLTETEISSITNLTIEESKRAKQRDFSEPLIWQGDDNDWLSFTESLKEHDLSYLQGGRFRTVSGLVDKSKAMRWLCDYYTQQMDQKPLTIALGDSENDMAMLENADYAVLIRSPAHALPEVKHDNLIITEEYGPLGWNNSLLALLNNLELEKIDG